MKKDFTFFQTTTKFKILNSTIFIINKKVKIESVLKYVSQKIEGAIVITANKLKIVICRNGDNKINSNPTKTVNKWIVDIIQKAFFFSSLWKSKRTIMLKLFINPPLIFSLLSLSWQN
ncbi:hypothetical protein SCLARK_00551 [Spiroplasma clarkii]|nr:hypothetical protein SCLARK_00551 [Spiroplasma clarkii]